LWAGVCLVHSGTSQLVFSAGFTDEAVLQRSTSVGAAIYGFTNSTNQIYVSVSGTDAAGSMVGYTVAATLSNWTGGDDIHPDTPAPPAHGNTVWRAQLKPSHAGGNLSITADDGSNPKASLSSVTHGDVWFCSGQSNSK
jgi:hypothetical protein